MSRWHQGLNPDQIQAVEHNEGPLLILAGAGSGKTTTLVARTGRLLEDGVIRASELAVLTFTNKAARELKHRVQNRLGDSAREVWAGTFHSFGLRLLRKNHKLAGLPSSFGVLDSSDCVAILRELLKDTKVVGKDKYDLDKVLGLVNVLRAGKPKQQAFDEYHEIAEMLLPKFTKKMDLLGAVDFEGLLIKPYNLLRENPEVLEGVQNQLRFLMVDEFQDTNDLQMKLIDILARKHRNLTVVGDDDQSIYGWRGAEVRNILDFPKTYKPCVVVKLEKNYRSSPAILEVANHLIGKNKNRHGKQLIATKHAAQAKLPEVFYMDSEEEECEFVLREIREKIAAGVSLSDIAVLYRSNSQSGLIESALREHRLEYTVSGGTAFFDRKEIKDILAYLRFSIAPQDVSLRRIINTPNRGVGDTTVEALTLFSQQRQVSFFQACKNWREAGVNEKAGASIESLFQFTQALAARIMNPNSTQTPGQNLLQALQEIHYREYLTTTSADPLAAQKRWTLVEIFSRVLDGFAKKGGVNATTYRDFVDAMELRDEPDSDKEKPSLSLMTLHACKGLEFPHVIIVGVEEDLLPHKTLGSDVDEERRLFYVGLTRAQDSLVLTSCKSRMRYGQRKPITMSRFLIEIPHTLVHVHHGAFRPVTAAQREDLVSNFLAGLKK